MTEKIHQSKISIIVFLLTIGVVLINLISVIFPALILTNVSTYDQTLDSFTLGYWAIPLLVSNFVIFGIGFAFYKNKLPQIILQSIKYILNFEISRKVALIVGLIILSIYIGFSIEELFLDELIQYRADHGNMLKALEIWPFGESESSDVKDHVQRHSKNALLYISQDILQNIKFVPFIASILLVIVTYFFTVQISKKRFSGIISMVVLLQSYTFLQ